jgi:hypothetical protein
MDYSLVVGVDDQQNELVVGIVGKLSIAVIVSTCSNHGQITSGLTLWIKGLKLGSKYPRLWAALRKASRPSLAPNNIDNGSSAQWKDISHW